MSGNLRITWVKSSIGYPGRQKATIRALGLRRLGQTVIQKDTPVARGMVRAVEHLVVVEELGEECHEGARTGPGQGSQA